MKDRRGHFKCLALTPAEARAWIKIPGYSPRECEDAYFKGQESPIQRPIVLYYDMDPYGNLRAA